MSLSDEQRRNAKKRPGPLGWSLKSALAALPRLETEPLRLTHGALLSAISGTNAVAEI